MMRTERGKLFVVSGPSGAGKSTVIARVMAARDDLAFSVSATTRGPRDGEIHGINYFFIDHKCFDEMIANDEFLEYAEYVTNFYGTPRQAVMDKLASGMNVLLDIEVQGAAQVRERMPEAVTIFLTPASFTDLEQRLRNRHQDSEEMIQSRLERAKSEYRAAESYDYIVINDDPDVAANELNSIITAELCRTVERIKYLEV
ncbi:MAG TPA: guanylate kinase [Clostridiales bacterium]|nr:guanylate kinase [Clostridiales bacterium]